MKRRDAAKNGGIAGLETRSTEVSRAKSYSTDLPDGWDRFGLAYLFVGGHQGRPSTRAVAPMSRSIGSVGYEAVNSVGLSDMGPVKGLTIKRASISRRKDSTDISSLIRPRCAVTASSYKLMTEMVKPLSVFARVVDCLASFLR